MEAEGEIIHPTHELIPQMAKAAWTDPAGNQEPRT